MSTLQRTLPLHLIVFYGVGTILGAGIYALIGKVIGEAGALAPLAFLLSALLATASAVSYAKLGSAYPHAGGSALYIHKVFGAKRFAGIVGVLVALGAAVSAATLSKSFVEYLQEFVSVPEWVALIGILVILASLASLGIEESAWTALVFTVLEVSGLLFIIGVTQPEWASGWPQFSTSFTNALSPASVLPVLSGAFVAFYAYIGFEDIANMAEEVRSPERNLPLAIGISLLTVTALYCAVTVAVLLTSSASTIADAPAPLAHVYQESTGNDPWLITLISLIAVINGALVQIIVAARLLYSVTSRSFLPDPLHLQQISKKTHTPIRATVVAATVSMAAALVLPLQQLAEVTSILLLLVFIAVNVTAGRIGIREKQWTTVAVAATGALSIVLLLGVTLSESFLSF